MSTPTLDILCLEPWLGGSHAAFLEGWRDRSAHDVEVVGLAPRHWSWRMRSAPWEFARRLAREARRRPDVLWVSDYVDLPALIGFLPADWAGVPTFAYFHENQLDYPRAESSERDGHPAWTNLATVLRADAVAFNSDYHRRSLREASARFLAALPKPNPRVELEAVFDAAHVVPPGIDHERIPLGAGGDGPLRVLFPHRWEHDKRPAHFLRAVREVLGGGASLELVLLGERGGRLPDGVAELLDAVRPAIAHEGFVESRDDYHALIASCDLVVSTADHEFYGIAVAEALAAGCAPLLPNRLAYPELIAATGDRDGSYDEGTFAARLAAWAANPAPARDPRVRTARRDALRSHDRARTAELSDAIAEESAQLSRRR